MTVKSEDEGTLLEDLTAAYAETLGRVATLEAKVNTIQEKLPEITRTAELIEHALRLAADNKKLQNQIAAMTRKEAEPDPPETDIAKQRGTIIAVINKARGE